MPITRFDQENQTIQLKILKAQETTAAELTKIREALERLVLVVVTNRISETA